jgi:hypothetical protein
MGTGIEDEYRTVWLFMIHRDRKDRHEYRKIFSVQNVYLVPKTEDVIVIKIQNDLKEHNQHIRFFEIIKNRT